ncbi:hypothetical protein HanIR_Chr16g0831531 [Helianthus annuus]|nr:hypothetical protein HanIR_Chr16g0831531 [Helianthus annuus]
MNQSSQHQMQHNIRKRQSWTHPSSCTKRDELKITTFEVYLDIKKPLWLEPLWVWPHIRVLTHGPQVTHDLRVFWDYVTFDLNISYGFMRD